MPLRCVAAGCSNITDFRLIQNIDVFGQLFRTIMSANTIMSTNQFGPIMSGPLCPQAQCVRPIMSARPIRPAHYVLGPTMSGPLRPRAHYVRPIRLRAQYVRPIMSAGLLCPAHYVRGPIMSGPLCLQAHYVRPTISAGPLWRKPSI